MSTSTTPSGLSNVAPTGQTCTHGECAQWLQSFGTKNDLHAFTGLIEAGESVVAAIRRVHARVFGSSGYIGTW